MTSTMSLINLGFADKFVWLQYADTQTAQIIIRSKSTDRGFLGQLKGDPVGEIEAARLQRGKS